MHSAKGNTDSAAVMPAAALAPSLSLLDQQALQSIQPARQAAAPVLLMQASSTAEAGVYLQAIQLISTTTVASADECSAACIADAACKVWAYCPANATAG